MYFYPRSPCGERLVLAVLLMCNLYFYPRSPCGERPGERTSIKPIFRISIHALLAESDRRPIFFWHPEKHFYPRSPCGERPVLAVTSEVSERISIHALLAESDIIDIINNVIDRIFLSTLSLRRATLCRTVSFSA